MASARRGEYDAGLMLFSIAKLSSWRVEGVSISSMWGQGKTPAGVKAIREKASSDVEEMYNLVLPHSHSNVVRSNKTSAFYELVRNVYQYREDSQSPKSLIEDFCAAHLSIADRNTLPGAKVERGSNGIYTAFKAFI